MYKIIDLCKTLDQNKLFQLADKVFEKYASRDSILDKKIFIPYEIRKMFVKFTCKTCTPISGPFA